MIARIVKGVSRTHVVDTAWAFFGLLGPSILQLLYTIVAARALNPAEFGKLQLCVSVGTIMMAFSGLGAGGLVLKNVAREPDRAAAFLGQSIVWTAITAPVVVGLSLLIMLGVSQQALPISIALCIGVSELIW